MIKKVTLALLFLALAVWIGQQVIKGSGYLLIVLPDGKTSIEMSFWVGVVLLVVSWFVSFWVLQTLGWLRKPLQGIQAKYQQSKSQRALNATLKGLVELSHGKWSSAKKRLLSAAKNSGVPLINYLAAAQAAHYEAKDEEVEELLHKALSTNSEAAVSVDFLQAKMQLSRKQYEQALATLVRLHAKAPKHPVVLNLLKETHVQLEDWQPLIKLLPSLQKHLFTPADFQPFEVKVYLGYFASQNTAQLTATDFNNLVKEWDKLPNHLKVNSSLALSWLKIVLAQRSFVYAEQLISNTLKISWSAELIEAYGLLPAEIEPKRRLLKAEKWLKERPADAKLLHALARICQQQSLWRQALEYLQASYQLEVTTSVCLELAQLYKALGEPSQADFYRGLAMQQLTNKLPSLPLPN